MLLSIPKLHQIQLNGIWLIIFFINKQFSFKFLKIVQQEPNKKLKKNSNNNNEKQVNKHKITNSHYRI